jgi:hypothetical protein
MEKITAKEKHTFYADKEYMTINAPIAGLVVANHKDISIIPRIVPQGESKVIALRMESGIVSVEAGEEIGVVIAQETVTPAAGAATTDGGKA